MAPHSTVVPFLGAPSQAGLGTSSQQKQEGEGKIKKPLERGLPPPADPAILTALPLAGASLPFSVSSTTSFFSFRSWKEQKSRRVTQIPADWVRQGADQVRKKNKTPSESARELAPLLAPTRPGIYLVATFGLLLGKGGSVLPERGSLKKRLLCFTSEHTELAACIRRAAAAALAECPS